MEHNFFQLLIADAPEVDQVCLPCCGAHDNCHLRLGEVEDLCRRFLLLQQVLQLLVGKVYGVFHDLALLREAFLLILNNSVSLHHQSVVVSLGKLHLLLSLLLQVEHLFLKHYFLGWIFMAV